MRFVALALILASFPIFVVLMRQYPARRDWAIFAVGALMFFVGTAQVDASFYGWPTWPGIARGFLISPIDTLCMALLVTHPRKPRIRVHYLWLMLLYILPSILSLVVSVQFVATLFVPFQIARVTLMFYALALELHRPAAMRSLLSGVAAGLIFQCGSVISQKASGIVQAQGTTDHQNILGLMVEASVIPLLALVLEGNRRKLLLAGIVASMIIVAAGGSRATMVFVPAGMVALLILSLVRKPSAQKFKYLFLSLAAGLVVVPFGISTLDERFGSKSMEIKEDARWTYEKAANLMAKDYPFGVGANNYVVVANTQGYSQRAGVEWGGGNRTIPVHNSYLLMRTETGWFGWVIIYLVVWIPVVGGLVTAFANRRSPMAGMALATSISCLIIGLHINYEFAWHLEFIQRLFFMNLAILSAAMVASAREKRERGQRQLEAKRAAKAAAAPPPLSQPEPQPAH